MSWWSKLFGGDKATASLIDNVSAGLDKLVYTDEEQAEDIAQARREGRQVFMEWMRSTSGSRIARRLIAVMVTAPWSFAHVVSMLFDAAAPFISGVETVSRVIDGEIKQVTVLASEKYSAAADSLSANAHENNALVGVVLLFYFGGPAAVEGVKGMVTKWVSK